ncbi:hypothetical protein GUITHDRAFT_52845, partial [Guillardia theta CCMP2712]
DVTGDGGCLKRVLEKGVKGERPFAGDVFELGLDKSDAILGWETVIPWMERGERAEFRFGPEYAFGKQGAPPRIAPDAVVDCTLKLLSFSEP